MTLVVRVTKIEDREDVRRYTLMVFDRAPRRAVPDRALFERCIEVALTLSPEERMARLFDERQRMLKAVGGGPH